MRTKFLALAFAALAPVAAVAQQPAALDAVQINGRQLLNQHCAICHLKPQLGAKTFGPALDKTTLDGNPVALRDFIGNGDARMPGFKYEFSPAQVNAIIAYLQTVPAPADAAPQSR